MILRLVRMIAAAMPHLGGCAVTARELCRNVAMVLHNDEHDGVHTDPEQIAREAIEHRVRHFDLTCADPTACAHAIADAWRRSRDTRGPMRGDGLSRELGETYTWRERAREEGQEV